MSSVGAVVTNGDVLVVVAVLDFGELLYIFSFFHSSRCNCTNV